MIKKVLHQDIDREKYRNCLQNAVNYRVYAEDWYLDAHTDSKWDCLVYNDYEAVMPLPYLRKFGLKIIYQPIYCQQLGVFHPSNFDKNKLQQFSEKFLQLPVYFYQLNEENADLNFADTKVKKNHLLPLNDSYEELRKNYRRDRRSDLKRIEKKALTISTEFYLPSLIEELKKKYPYFTKYYTQPWYERLMREIISRKQFTYYQLLDDVETIASVFFIHSQQRRILLFSTRNEKPAHRGANSYLIDYFIQNHSNQDLLLDFEGSTVAGIADFYESFGGKPQSYHRIENSKLQLIRKIIKV
mgnify:FL=1